MNAKWACLRSQRAVVRQEVLKEPGESIEEYVRRRVVGAKTRELYTKIATPLVTIIRKAKVTRTVVVMADAAVLVQVDSCLRLAALPKIQVKDVHPPPLGRVARPLQSWVL